jgi:hypothetical protein
MPDQHEVHDHLVAVFLDDFHRLDPDVLATVSAAVADGSVTRAAAIASVAEMLRIPVPRDASLASAPPRPEARSAPREDPSFVDGCLAEAVSMDAILAYRLVHIQNLRRAWYKDVSEAITIASSSVQAARKGGYSDAPSDAGAAVDFLRELAAKQRMKERVELRHLPALLVLISSTLSTASDVRGTPSGHIEACLDAARAMHSRFDARIQALLRQGGSAEAMNASNEALTQFHVLREQAQHHAKSRSDRAGEVARLFVQMVR